MPVQRRPGAARMTGIRMPGISRAKRTGEIAGSSNGVTVAGEGGRRNEIR